LEGSVEVVGGNKKSLLKPGQQAQVTTANIAIVNDADLDATMAWKNGKFLFTSADLESIMRQAARWYDVDVQFDRKTNKRFNFETPKNINLSNLLKALEISGNVKFSIDGKKITVQ
jgi:transmembrane sensor